MLHRKTQKLQSRQSSIHVEILVRRRKNAIDNLKNGEHQFGWHWSSGSEKEMEVWRLQRQPTLGEGRGALSKQTMKMLKVYIVDWFSAIQRASWPPERKINV